MPRFRAFSFVGVLAVAGAAFAQESGSATEAVALDQKLMGIAKEKSEIMKNLGYLSDHIGPRLTGSAALKRANDWAAEVMKSYDLENVHLESWSIPAGWERGTAYAKIVEPNNGRTLHIASGGWSGSTKGKVTGDVVYIDAKNSADLEKYRGKLKNAIVLRAPPATVRPIDSTPMTVWSPEKGGKKEGGEKAVAKGDGKEKGDKGGQRKDRAGGFDRLNFGAGFAFRSTLNEFLQKEGAAAVLNDCAKPQGLFTMSGGWRGPDRATAPEPVPTVYIAHEHYALLYRLATTGEKKCKVEIELVNKIIPGPINCYNTVGEIKGSEKPDEFVIVGAHIDSWDLGSGTTDNGTGTTIVLETARIIMKSGVKPKRTIRFVLFSGEEQGLHGSKAYVDAHKDELPKMSMCLVHDTGTGKVLGIGLQGREVLKPILEKELASLKAVGVEGMTLASLGGSDHASFDRAGVPGFAVQQDMSEYRLTHHTQTDTLDKVHEENLIQGAQVLSVSAMRVANYPTLLPRDRPERRFPGKGKGGKDGKEGEAKDKDGKKIAARE